MTEQDILSNLQNIVMEAQRLRDMEGELENLQQRLLGYSFNETRSIDQVWRRDEARMPSSGASATQNLLCRPPSGRSRHQAQAGRAGREDEGAE